MFNKLNKKLFFLSLCIGLFYCYLTTPQPEVILKFPTPFNAGKIMYKDNSDTCYKYKATKETCPKDKKLIKAQPIQENFLSSENLNESVIVEKDGIMYPKNNWGEKSIQQNEKKQFLDV